MILKRTGLCLAATALALGGCMTTAPIEPGAISYVGGAAMYPSKTIVGNAANSPEHTTLVAAVTAAGLIDTAADVMRLMTDVRRSWGVTYPEEA